MQTQQPKRLLGLDVGDSNVGVAVTDPGNTRAIPHSTLLRRMTASGRLKPVEKFGTTRSYHEHGGQARKAPQKTIPRPTADVAAELQSLIQELDICGLVVGLPLPKPGDGVPPIQCAKVSPTSCVEGRKEWF